MTNEKLNKLVESGSITSYELVEGEPDETDRLADKLTILFPNGDKLVLATFCSGSSESTCLIIDSESLT